MTEPHIPPPLAEFADTAARPAGPCSICQRGILTGDRYALVVPDGRAAHLMCIGVMAAARRSPVPVIR